MKYFLILTALLVTSSTMAQKVFWGAYELPPKSSEKSASMMAKQAGKAKELVVISEAGDTLEVIGFILVGKNRGNLIDHPAKGARITPTQKKYIYALRQGTKFWLEHIRIKGTDGEVKEIDDRTIRIK